jgi:citrate lyase beta subunit
LADADERGDGAVNANGVLVDLAHGKQARLIGERCSLMERNKPAKK